ncbi:MAG TPA: OmpA family protein [Longimicrobiales bacterium]|nr:OmpA family protein [Longimicrobiales bacterium]
MVMLAVLAAFPAAASAQMFPGAGGVEFRLGVAAPEDLPASELSSGFSVSGDVDLGYVGRPWLRFIGGVNYFGFDVQQGDSVVGDASNFALRGGLRADALGDRRTAASLLAALSLNYVSASVPSDPNVGDLLEGIYAGFTFGVGARYALDDRARTAFVVEARRTFVTNIDHWAFEAGFRYMVRGTGAYQPAPEDVPAAPGIGGSGRASDDDARARERERLREEERLRAQEEARRAERDMQAGAEAEAARRQLEAERARADSLERASAAEAEARAAAEARAEAAAAAARAAEARATEAETRMAEAFADLDRILVNVAGVTETDRGLVVTLGSGTFASGQASLTAQARGEVGRIARVLQEFPEGDIVIEGHTDSVGEETANQALSERRAEAVRAALIAEGLSPRRVTALGFGESRPVSENDTPAGRAENRRVEIIILTT